jgi:hypothetical protein
MASPAMAVFFCPDVANATRPAGVPPRDGVGREFVPEHDGGLRRELRATAAAPASQAATRDMEHWHANR